jgi:CRP/FNR family transcriptional regulator, cyclic AMP receptor protein
VLDERYRAALAASQLSALPDDTLAALVTGSAFVDVPAGAVFLRLGGPAFACVVIEGLVRTFLVSADGRELSVRYSRSGDVNGVTALFARPLSNISQQAVTDSRVLLLRTETAVDLAARDVGLANVFLRDLAERSASYIHALASTTLSPLRENVVRHLLDLAGVDDRGRLVARVTQQQLANHVGTVREVVGRLLRDLREQGLVLTGRDEIVLVDAERLHHLTWPRSW